MSNSVLKINYVAPVGEPSGYGVFARNVIRGLSKVGADVKVNWLKIDQFQSLPEDIGLLLGKHSNPDINLINIVPTLFQPNRHSKAKKQMGLTMFEASRIPQTWVDACNQMDAILVPCERNVGVFKQSGVKVPVKWVPPPLGFEKYDGKIRAARAPGSPFVFYSIFQWSERKNPQGLIRAYWAAFTGKDDVVLRLKLYLKNQDQAEFVRIQQEVAALKQMVKLRHYPKIEFETRHLNDEAMVDLHLGGDVFVSASRGEGLGLPAIEAMALSTPSIVSRCSGHEDFIPRFGGFCLEDVILNHTAGAHTIPCSKSPTMGMGQYSSFYEGNAFWDEPDLEKLAQAMFDVYSGRNDPNISHYWAELGRNGAAIVRKQFNQTDRAKELLEILGGI